MKELRIDNINNYEYTLVDVYDKVYRMNIELRGINANVGDKLFLNDKLLREKMLTFEVNDRSDDAMLESDGNITRLKRIYG